MRNLERFPEICWATGTTAINIMHGPDSEEGIRHLFRV